MKLKKPSGSSALNVAAATGGGIVGGAVSKGIFGLVHTPTVGADAATVTKEENFGMLKRGAIAVLAIGAASAIDGTDAGASSVRGAAIGMAVVQILEVGKTFFGRTSLAATETDSAAKKFASRALGLGCPCDQVSALNGRGLRYPIIPVFNRSNMDYAPAETSSANPLAQLGSSNPLAA